MPYTRAFHAALGLVVFAMVTTVVGGLGVGLRLMSEVAAELDRIQALRPEMLALSSEVFDQAGVKIGELADERRYYVPLKELPPHLVQAFLSAEDKNFYRHGAISAPAILRSAVADLRGGRLSQGASTITQQLARLAFLDQRKTWERKVKEALLALAIERKLSKSQILELYLNRIFLGNHSYGVEAASRNYFRKHAIDLDVAEAALLAGLPQSPSRYAPNRHPVRAAKRQRLVLQRMADDGALGRGDVAAWARRRLRISRRPEDFGHVAPYFLAVVRRDLASMFESDTLRRDGLKIFTTLDSSLQQAAADELHKMVAKARPGARGEARVEGALVSLAPDTGAVLAMQGGGDFGFSQFNRTEATRRPLGAAFVPIYVAEALERGYTLASRIGDDPISGKHLLPESGAPTLYEALLRGLWLEAAPLYTQLGGGSVLALASRLGLKFRHADLSVALGRGEATPTELAVAYAAMINGGHRVTPYLIARVEGPDGHTLYEAQPDGGPQALGVGPAYIVGQALVDTVHYGINRPAAAVSELAGGLSATSEDLHDAWFVGTLPTVVTAIWCGAEHGQERLANEGEAARRLPMRAWTDYMLSAPPDYVRLAHPPPAPPGISFVRRPQSTLGARSVPFMSGTQPRDKRLTF